MRQWRVGTLSMGVSLVLMGIVIFISQWTGGFAAADSLLVWWPLVFVLLGLEILACIVWNAVIVKKAGIALSGSAETGLSIPAAAGQPTPLKYDMFSILIVGLLGTLCLLFMGLSTSGLMEEIRYSIKSVEHTADLPEISKPVPKEVNRIVIQTNQALNRQLRIHPTETRSVQLFGTYTVTANDGNKAKPLSAEELCTIRQVGQTLYFTIKRPPGKRGFADEISDVNLTLVLPKDIKADIDAGYMGAAAPQGEWSGHWQLIKP